MFRQCPLRGYHLLGTSIARPLISKRQIEIARETGADAASHGATGKGNDQIRFELGHYALEPDIKVIAPWREWDLDSRSKLMEFARNNQIPISRDKIDELPIRLTPTFCPCRKGVEELGWADDDIYTRSVSPENAPDTPTRVEIDFQPVTGGD